jgi:carbamoyl-phosphate synthase large subunit
MDDLKVLITGAGAPGIKGTLYSLKNNFDGRQVNTIGTDARKEVIGKYLCDKFYQIPMASDPKYIEKLFSVCEKENVNVVLPQNTAELFILSESMGKFESLGTNIALSDRKSIDVANNKYKLMSLAKNIGVPTPEFYLVDTFVDLVKFAKILGWPEKPVVVKPPISNGMRGIRIINEYVDLKENFYFEKPTSLNIHMDHLKSILGENFPSLLVMEYLPNEEWTVDVLSAEDITVVTRKRDLIRSGITFEGTCEKNEQLIEYSSLLSKEIGLKYAFGFQFKLDANNVPKLLESNPRVQGTMILSTFAKANIIYGAVKCALDENIPKFDIRWGTKIMRYWGGIGIDGNVVLDVL